MIFGRRHRWLARIWLRRVGEPRRSEWIADLEDDYVRRRQHTGWLAADRWFVRELASLAGAARADRHRRDRGERVLNGAAAAAMLQLRRTPIFFLTATLMLAAGVTIAATTAAFIDATLFRPISRVRPTEIFRLSTSSPTLGDRAQFAFPDIDVVAASLASAGDIAGTHLVPVVARAGDTTEQTLAEVVTGRYFDVLALSPAAGRLLSLGDDMTGAAPAIVISESWWASRFDRSPAAIGSTILLNNAPFVIAGIAPASGAMTFVVSSTDVWVPAAHAAPLMPADFQHDAARRAFVVFGRVKPGVPMTAVEAAATTAADALRRVQPPFHADDRVVVGLGSPLNRTQRQLALMVAALLGSLAAIVLAVICANAGNLALARGSMLRRATAIRMSLGASRRRVIAESLCEGACIAAAAAICSVAAYAWIRRHITLVSVLPTLTLRLDLRGDLAFFAGMAGVAALAGLGLTLGPALAAARIDVIAALRDASGVLLLGRRSARARRGLVMAQIGLSFFLMAMAALFVRSIAATRDLDLGVDVDRLAIMDLDVEPHVSATEQRVLVARALDAIRQIPGVASATLASEAPIDAFVSSADVRWTPSDPPIARASLIEATAGYFDTVGVPILYGRGFNVTDRSASVAVINETLARQLEGGGLDRVIDLGQGRQPRIVGIARNAKYRSIGEDAQPHVYLVAAPQFHQSLVVRAAGDPRPLLVEIQRTLERVGPGIQGFFPRTGRDHLKFDLLPVEAGGSAATIVGVLAVILSGLGLYGLVAWIVELRRPEFGVRLALGARPSDLRSLVLRYAAASALPGIVIGLLAVLLAAAAFRTVFFGVSPADPIALLAAGALIAGLVVLAAWWPARTAARIDPSQLLR